MNKSSTKKFINLSNILLKISKSKEIDEGPYKTALTNICISACEGLNIERASIWLLDSLKSFITCQMTCSSKGVIKNETLILKEENFPQYFKALFQERSLVANDALTNPSTIEFKDNYLIPLGITSMLDCPIHLRGKMVGILCCENTGPAKTWLQEEQSFAASLADLTSRAIIANEKMIAEEKLKNLSSLS